MPQGFEPVGRVDDRALRCTVGYRAGRIGTDHRLLGPDAALGGWTGAGVGDGTGTGRTGENTLVGAEPA